MMRLIKKAFVSVVFGLCMFQIGNVAFAYEGDVGEQRNVDGRQLSDELRLAIAENKPVSAMSKTEQKELAEILPQNGSGIGLQSDKNGGLRSIHGFCTASTQNIHLRSSMGKKYIGNKPTTSCDNVAKYIQIDTILFRKEWYGWGNPTSYSNHTFNANKFTNNGISRKCNDYTNHDWRAINSHYIIDKFGCKHMLYSSTTAKDLKCA